MLLHCVISFLYMRVLKNIFGKYFFSYFFLCFSAFLCEASGRWFFLSGRCGSFRPDVPTSSPDVRISAVSYVALRLDGVSDTSGRGTLEG
jgi:hypothetical protein